MRDVAERWRIWGAEKERRLFEESDKGLSSSVVFDAMNRLRPADAIIAVEIGNNTYSFGHFFECEWQAVLMSGYLGSIIVFWSYNEYGTRSGHMTVGYRFGKRGRSGGPHRAAKLAAPRSPTDNSGFRELNSLLVSS